MSERSVPGLRERKKARTRELIQREALRLFREQGYPATTVEQIAEAAEVAASTVFRYFPTKEDLVLLESSPVFLDALAAAPAELGPVPAVRHALHTVITTRTPQELSEGLERERLMVSVPDLWAAGLDNVMGAVRAIEALLTERAGRAPGDVEVRNVTGAIVGVIMAAWFEWVRRPELDGMAEVDRALAHLERGLPLDGKTVG
ncbi:TetR/AcrR family transcriptional regulator [Pseudonocardia sp. GCM10023141]|uniref:TetR/AcrR family transcriptional regulator n=1 Tax=Pseudonocardia sp. GCM10023141 TaxID=3252653 RepID=UPI00360A9DCB